MKVLSLHEPWASFMARGYKKWETRKWATMYRGQVAIHAAKTDEHVWEAKLKLAEAGVVESAFGPDPFPMEDGDWPFGKIVAVGALVDCIPSVKARPSRMERALGDYTPGRAIWIFKDVRRVEPVHFRGMQGLKDLPPEVEAMLRFLEAA